LGFGRVAASEGTIVAADMMQINHYYPFGMNMEGNWNGPSGKNKYQYNEKELNSDFGLDWNDYGARFYDAAIGRFPSVDPLTDIYANQTPYAYAANNPATLIDYMGMGPAGQGADGMTNEQWVNASNPAGKGSEAASSAYRGSETGKANYERMSQQAATGQNRAITADDIAASYVLKPYGYYTSEVNVVEGYYLEISPYGNIIVNGGSAFRKRFEDDINVLNGTKEGSMTIGYIRQNTRWEITVGEASGYSLFSNRNPTPMEDLAASYTKSEQDVDAMGRKYNNNKISVRYAQHWGVMYDGAKTRSYLTLIHELKHVLDIIASGGMGGERFAVESENAVRKELNITEFRTHYHGQPLYGK
jgi:RHS repeat-associated protein